MHRAIKPDPHHLRDATGIVAVRLVDPRLQHRPHVPRLNADHRQISFSERTEQPLRQRSSFQSNPLEAIAPVPQNREQCIRFARDSHLARNLSSIIHNADARVLDRNVQSSKIVHAALLLMLGARTTVTPFHHQPEAQHPKIFQLSTSCRPITPSFGTKRTLVHRLRFTSAPPGPPFYSISLRNAPTLASLAGTESAQL